MSRLKLSFLRWAPSCTLGTPVACRPLVPRRQNCSSSASLQAAEHTVMAVQDGRLVPAREPIPSPRPGNILIKTRYAGVNRPDILQRTGAYPAPPGASPILGLEVSGHVAALGAGAAETKLDLGLAATQGGCSPAWKEGDPVFALCNGGGYAEYVEVPATQVLPLHAAALSLQSAAALPEALWTAWMNLVILGRASPGQAIFVQGGAGGVGHIAVQLASVLGAGLVISTAGGAAKCQAVLDHGADAVLDYRVSAQFADTLAASPFAPLLRRRSTWADWAAPESSAEAGGVPGLAWNVEHRLLGKELPSVLGDHTLAAGNAAHPADDKALCSVIASRSLLPDTRVPGSLAPPGDGVDVILDMIGGSYFAEHLKLLGTGGTLVHIAFQAGSTVQANLMRLMLKRLRVTGSTLRSRSDAAKAGIALDLAQLVLPRLCNPDARVHHGLIAPAIHATMPLHEAQAAHDILQTGQVLGKVLLEVSE